MSLRPVKQIIQTKPPSKARESNCSAPSASARQRTSIRSCCWTTSATTIRRTIWRDFRGIRTAASRPSPTCWRARWSTATASGNKGKMTAGDVQWMTAGSGILHQEMPKGDQQGRMHGFQLWANLPASLKMTDPRYQDIPSQRDPRGHGRRRHARRASSAASSGASGGPWKAWRRTRTTSTSRFRRDGKKRLKIETTRNAFAYVFAGSGTFRDSSDPRAVLTEQVAKPDAAPVYDASNHSLVLFDRGDEIVVQAGPEGIRFLLVSGKPIEEPVAWYGPIVMNTQERVTAGHE